MSTQVKQIKISLIIFFGSIAYFTGIYATHFFRVATDEKHVFPDIVNMYLNGNAIPRYGNGGYQSATVSLLRITGFDWEALGLWSMIFGGFAIGFFTISLLVIFRREQMTPYWGFLLPAVAMFSLPVFIKRMLETTHKTYTYILVFALLTSIYIYLQTNDDRFKWLLVTFTIPISMINYVWGIIWSCMAVFILGLSIKNIDIRYRNRVSSTILLLIPITVALYYPLSRIHTNYVLLFKQALFPSRLSSGMTGTTTGAPGTTGTTTSALGTTETTTSLIAGWPTVAIAGVDINTWFIYTAGTLVIALISGASSLLFLRDWLKKDLSPVSWLFFGVAAYFGIIIIIFSMTGRIATIKRLIAVPGILGVLYFVNSLSSLGIKTHTYLKAVLVVLILTGGLASERTILDGDGQPYDHYASANEVAKIQWFANYENDCLQSYQQKDSVLYSKVWHSKRGIIEKELDHNIIYSSGRAGKLTCVSVNKWWVDTKSN